MLRSFTVLFSRGGHTACWFNTTGYDVTEVFGRASMAWLIREKRPMALVVVETKDGKIKEDGELCGFDTRASDNIITYYTRAGMKHVSA